MYSHSFRSSVVTGSFTLPVMAVLTLVVWMFPDVENWKLWAGLGMTFLTAYSIMELNNRHALLRVRSRMMSVSFLTLMLTCPALHAWHIGTPMLGYASCRHRYSFVDEFQNTWFCMFPVELFTHGSGSQKFSGHGRIMSMQVSDFAVRSEG